MMSLSQRLGYSNNQLKSYFRLKDSFRLSETMVSGSLKLLSETMVS